MLVQGFWKVPDLLHVQGLYVYVGVYMYVYIYIYKCLYLETFKQFAGFLFSDVGSLVLTFHSCWNIHGICVHKMTRTNRVETFKDDTHKSRTISSGMCTDQCMSPVVFGRSRNNW